MVVLEPRAESGVSQYKLTDICVVQYLHVHYLYLNMYTGIKVFIILI